MKLLSFVAIKGGVGKTTLALLTGQYLASKDHRVLFIDLDHQSNQCLYWFRRREHFIGCA